MGRHVRGCGRCVSCRLVTRFLVNGLEQFGLNAPPDTSVPPAVPNLPGTTLLVLCSILGVSLVPNPYLYSKYRIFKILKLLAELQESVSTDTCK